MEPARFRVRAGYTHRPGRRAGHVTQEDTTGSSATLAETRFGVLRSSCGSQILEIFN
ncbi:MAG: hypothetical protein M3317_06710 [Actinomycetota bacterium]|nr:hypothetical protein [Actinomycetota bacterium]